MSPAAAIQVIKRLLAGGLFRDGLWSTATTAVTVALQMAEIVVLSRILPTEILGAYFLVTAFPELIQGLLDLRLQEVMIKYLIGFIHAGDIQKASALVKVTWLVSAAAGLAIILIVAVVAPLASALVGGAADKKLMVLFAFGLFLGSLQGRSGAILRALGRFDLNFWIAAAIAVLRFGLVVAPVLFKLGLPGLIGGRVVAQCIASLIVGVTSYLLLRSRMAVDFSAPISVLRPMWKELTHFAFHLNLASVAKSLAQRMDTILVGALLNPSAVAAYKVVGQLGKAMFLISDPLMTAAYPRFVRLISLGDVQGLNRLARRSTFALAAVLLPILLLFTFFPGPLLHAFAGSKYEGLSWLLPLFMWSNVLAIVFFWVHPYLLSLGLPQIVSLSNIVGRLAGLATFGALLAFWAIPGAAIGSALPQCFTVATALYSIWRFNRTRREQPLVPSGAPST
jgi:O-antigen/teichoic acid export membrane protein